MSKQELKNTFVFVILGDPTNAKIRTGLFSLFCNYSSYSNSVVISRLSSLRGIPSENIIVFAYEKASDYDMTVVPTQEVFFQLTIDEIYKDAKTPEKPPFPLNFQNFNQLADIYRFLEQRLRPEGSNPNIIVFMDDNAFYEEFEPLEFVKLY